MTNDHNLWLTNKKRHTITKVEVQNRFVSPITCYGIGIYFLGLFIMLKKFGSGYFCERHEKRKQPDIAKLANTITTKQMAHESEVLVSGTQNKLIVM